MNLRNSSVLFGMLVMLFAATASVAHAQTDDQGHPPFTIRLIDLDPDNPARVDFRTHLGNITAVVDGAECSVVNAAAPTPPVLLIGLPNQPDECQREGATVLLFAENGGERVEQFSIAWGETAELGNYGPSPLATGGLLPGNAGSGVGTASSSSDPMAVIAIVAAGLGLLLLGLRGALSLRSSTHR